MFDLIKKTVLAGVGAAVITKEKAEVALEDFVQQGKISAADAKALAKKIAEQGKAEYKTVSSDIEAKIKSYTYQPDLQSKARIAELEARLAALEARQKPVRHAKPATKPKAKKKTTTS